MTTKKPFSSISSLGGPPLRTFPEVITEYKPTGRRGFIALIVCNAESNDEVVWSTHKTIEGLRTYFLLFMERMAKKKMLFRLAEWNGKKFVPKIELEQLYRGPFFDDVFPKDDKPIPFEPFTRITPKGLFQYGKGWIHYGV